MLQKFTFLGDGDDDNNTRVFIRRQRLENSVATTQNSPSKFCLFPERALPFSNNPPITLQYSLATPILNENPEHHQLHYNN